MARVERILLYSVLSALLVAVFGGSLPMLNAPAVATAPSIDETLGPADSILLNGAKGELALKNADGHLAWSDRETARAWSIAAVNLTAIMPELLTQGSFKEELAEFDATAAEQDAEFRAQFEALQDEYGDLKPDDPQLPEAQGRAQALMTNYNDWQKRSQQIRGKKVAEQLESAYREAVEAVEVVADNQHIDVVYRFIPTSDEFKSDSPGHASEQIRLRTFLRYPEAVDITPAVLEELGL